MEGEQGANSMKMKTVHLLPEEQLMTLHQQMVENQTSYRQKLQTSQEAQHRQAVLVQKLQAKVLQYRNWCKELEQQVGASRGSIQCRRDHKEDHSLERALIQLEEEQHRCENLAGVNILLREHLDKANEVNGALREDVDKLMTDWTKARDELEHKENEWHKEREVFESYMRNEHDRFLGVWRQVVTLRRYFLEMKTAIDRDLSELKTEHVKLSSSIVVSCFRLSSGTQRGETNSLESLVLREQQQQHYVRPEKIAMENEIYQQAQAIVRLHVKGNLAKEDLHARVMELTALLEESQKQNEEKEKAVKTLRDTVEILEADCLKLEYEQSQIKNANKEILSLQRVIKEITQAVIDESTAAAGIPQSESYPESCSSLQPNPGDPDGALLLVRDVLARNSSEVQHLKVQLLASQNSASSLEKQQEQHEEQCTFLRERLEQLEGERDTLTTQLQHFQSVVETYRSDHTALEKSRKELQQQLEVLEQEVWHLRRSNTELQLKGDMVDVQKEEQQQELERIVRDREYIQEDRSALEEKHSLLKNELVAMREVLEKSHLDGELVKQEKSELVSALEQLEEENQALLNKVDKLEMIRSSSQKQLNQAERTNEERHAEKMRLEQLLHEEEFLQENLQEELRVLRDEQKEMQEKLSQAHQQHETSSAELEQALQGSSRLGELLTKVSREKESIMRGRAALEVQLGAVERERWTLTEQLAEFRAAKDLLESSLFKAQQQISQLEVTKGQLEMKVQAISQAKLAIQGEVKCLCIELEGEKSKVEQEKEDKARQLLQAEQKYQETLNHCQAVHKKEMNRVFQELEAEQEKHRIELEQMLKLIKEKEEAKCVFERKLLELKQEATTIQTQMKDELIDTERTKQEMLLEKEDERKSLLDELLQTKEELTSACQQLELLHQEVKKHQKREQNLEAELKDAQNTMEMLEKKTRDEVKSLKEEINFLLQQRDTLQNQVQDLESQLLTAKESCQLISQEAQQHLREVQELSKQKMLEVSHLQKLLEAERKQLEEAAHRNTELQSRKEEVEQWNTELRATLQSQWEEEQHLNQELLSKQEEAEHQHATVQALEREQSHWEEAKRHNSERYTALQRQWEEVKCQNKDLQDKKREAELQNVELRHQMEEVEHQNVQLKDLLQRQREEADQESAVLQRRWEEAQQRYAELQSWKEKVEHQNAELQVVLCTQQEELKCQNIELRAKRKEVEHQNTALEKMKKQQNQWEEVECQNAELKATLQALEQERASLYVSLEEKEARLKRLQDRDDAHQGEIAKMNTERQQAQQLVAEHRREVQELSTQMQSLKQMMLEKETALITRKEQLIQDLEELRASERHLRDSVQTLEAEASQLRLSLCGAESRAEALAAECQRACSARWETQSQLTKLHSVLQYMLCNSPETKLDHGGRGDRNTWSSLSLNREQDNVTGLTLPQLTDLSTELTVERVAEAIQDLRQDLWQARLERDEMKKNSEKLKQELSEKEAERDRVNAKAQELQKWMNQSQEEKKMAEGKRGSLETALKAEVIAFSEENVTLRGKLSTLEKTIESSEKQRKDVLNERDALLMAKEKLARELDLLQESVTASEIRANAMEKMNQSLEQELQATLSALRIKHEEIEIQQIKLMTLQQEAGVGKVLQENLDHLTVNLAKRDEEIKSQLEQIRDLEREREVQKADVEHLSKDLEKKGQETQSQKKQIEELGKQNEMQKAALERLNLDLEESLQTIKSQQEKIRNLEELTQSQKTIMESLTLNLEEKVKETKIKEEKIQILEKNGSSQIGALLKDVCELKAQLSEKDWELVSQKQLLQEREELGGKQVNSLHTSLEHMKAILKNKEREVESQREQIMNFQQCKAQREVQLHELHEKVKQMTFTLTLRDEQLESQKQQIKEREGEIEMELKALRELIAKTQTTLKKKDTELEFQRKLEEEVVRQVEVLLGDLQYSTALRKEKDGGGVEFQKEQRKEFKQELELGLQETRIISCSLSSNSCLKMLRQLKVVLKEREQEIKSLKEQHEKHKEKMERQIREMQANLQQALRKGEKELDSLKEENHQLQEQEKEAVAQIQSILEKLEFTRSSLQNREQEIKSLQEHITELSKQKDLEENTVKSLQWDLARINQLMKQKEEELLKQAEQISTYQFKLEDAQAELQACQNQEHHLEGIIKENEQGSERDFENPPNKHEQVRQPHLQWVEQCPGGQMEFLKEDQKGRGKEMKAPHERGQKHLKDEIKELQENIHNLQHTLKKRNNEMKSQSGKIKQLEERVAGKEKELLTCSEQLKQIAYALRLQDSEEDNLQSHIQKLLIWKEEELAKREAFQKRDQLLEWQKEKIQHLEEEKRVKNQELDRVTAILKQTESGEIEWREKAQKFGLSLAQSEEVVRVLREEMAVVQNMVSDRDKDRLHLQEQLDTAFRALEEERLVTKALTGDVDLLPRENDMSEMWHKGAGEGVRRDEGLIWLTNRRFLYKHLELLQQTVAKLENDKCGLKQHNTQLRDALEQVERERRRLKRNRGSPSLSFKLSQTDSGPQNISSLSKEETQMLYKQLAELQKQVSVLQKQLSLERKQKQDYIDSCAKTNQELSSLHQELSHSLAAVAREPEASVLKSEALKLDETINHSLVLAPVGWDSRFSEKYPMSSTLKTVQHKDSR
ncbi:centrosome-associated protein CEP250 isoform X3 [Hemicordylus capensis]|uniref:centrosome-associated protein CEP250 isoform X3 n=1 Tax=Hemicordylus capensis TaxID=884348 RepID=UPI0023045DF3|nr:centrosome-associated protein CEP250 isoform X3 [Hemicordylus capensis]